MKYVTWIHKTPLHCKPLRRWEENRASHLPSNIWGNLVKTICNGNDPWLEKAFPQQQASHFWYFRVYSISNFDTGSKQDSFRVSTVWYTGYICEMSFRMFTKHSTFRTYRECVQKIGRRKQLFLQLLWLVRICWVLCSLANWYTKVILAGSCTVQECICAVPFVSSGSTRHLA